MPRKTSNEIFADFYTDLESGKSRIATAFGINGDTAKAWSRPKPSEINPKATGKGNPVDQAARAIKVIHPHDPARAREIVDFLEQVCDELDRADGIFEADETDSPCAAIQRVVRSSSRLVMGDLRDCHDPKKLREALNKTRKLVADVNRLEACLKQLTGEDTEK